MRGATTLRRTGEGSIRPSRIRPAMTGPGRERTPHRKWGTWKPATDSVPPEQTRQLALDAHAVRREDPHLVGRIRRLERDGRAAAAEALQRCLLVVDPRDDDVAGLRHFGAADQRNVAVEDAGLDHRIAAHFEREVLAGREQVGRHVDDVTALLDGLDRRARGDAAHAWHGNRAGAR